jgi:hypothetical protein
VFVLGLLSPVAAQCPMCKKNVEAHLLAKGQVGAGLNTGILYLLSVPYLMVGTVAFLWWRRQRRMTTEQSLA